MVGRFVAQNHTHGPPADLWMLMTTKGDSSHTHMALGSEEVGKKNGVVGGESYLGTWLCGDDVTGGGSGGGGGGPLLSCLCVDYRGMASSYTYFTSYFSLN